MSQIDWGLLKVPNYFADGVNAQQAGQQRRDELAKRNAFARYDEDPDGAIKDLMAVDPKSGLAMRDDRRAQQAAAQRQGIISSYATDPQAARGAAMQAGDLEMVEAIGKLDAASREQAKERATGLATAAYGLSRLPYEQRRAKLAEMTPILSGFGLSPQDIAGFDPTDEAIQTVGAQAVGLKDMLEMERKDRQFVTLSPGQSLYQVGGNGPQPAAGGAAGQAQPAATRAPSGGMYDQVAQIAQANGASAEDIPYLQRLAQVESNANPNARNGSSTGIFQFQPGTFQSVGGGDINSVADQTKAALALARRDRAKLQEMGVPVTDANLYIMHQQGPGGGPALLTAPPEVNAVAALTPAYGGNAARARQAIVGNGGREDMSAGEFVNYWQNRWGGAGQGGSRPAPTQQAQAVPGAGVPAGARLVAQGAPKAPDWQEMTPAESARYGQGIWLKNKNGDVKPAVAAPSGRKSWSAALTAQQTDDISAIQTASSLNSTLKNALGQIESGRLNLGLMSNMAATGLNTVGMGNANTRNYASFKANLEKLRNDSLRLNKGVQTDGDAQRAWNELMANINDEGVVKQRLAEIMDLNERAVLFRSETINQRREDAGLPALDPSKFRYGSRPQAAPASVQRPAAATSRPAPAKPVVRPGTVDSGYRFKGGDPANPRNWEKL